MPVLWIILISWSSGIHSENVLVEVNSNNEGRDGRTFQLLEFKPGIFGFDIFVESIKVNNDKKM